MREKRKCSRKDNSENFLANLSHAFAEDAENTGDQEQVDMFLLCVASL